MVMLPDQGLWPDAQQAQMLRFAAKRRLNLQGSRAKRWKNKP